MSAVASRGSHGADYNHRLRTHGAKPIQAGVARNHTRRCAYAWGNATRTRSGADVGKLIAEDNIKAD